MEKDQLVFGVQPVLEAIRSGREIDRILMQKGMMPAKEAEIRHAALTAGISLQYVPREKLDRHTRKNHQGVIALMSMIIYHDTADLLMSLYEKGEIPLLLLLDGVTDVRNLGSIARTAFCAGVHGMILPEKGSARVTADAIKTSAGALLTFPVCKSAEPVRTIDYLRKSGLQVLAATEKASLGYHQADYSKPTVLVLGAEDEGIRQDILKQADSQVGIPMTGSIGSLNVAVAAGVILFEARRQRLPENPSAT
ncbi:MAG: 23S rRNA (guanosine(2251)-2'-O)-methyltransferase RlmB [Bacteroidales bacterium]|nr:23S rRNA (guanosine(2251)-2'-O)-methyltransferase RlmB [Bacteroidales bacterium]